MAYERFDPDRYAPVYRAAKPRERKEPPKPTGPAFVPHCGERVEGDEHVCPMRGCFLRWASNEDRPRCPLGHDEGND